MSSVIRRDLCTLSELLSHARLDLMIEAALLGPDMRSRVERHGLMWEDGGGSWLQVVLLAGDRAVVLGVDRDYSRTVGQVDLLEGLPAWVADVTRTRDDGQAESWLGFVLWWEDGAWWSAEHPVDDGAARIPLLGDFGEDAQLDAVGEAVAVAAMDHQREDDPREEQEVEPDAVRRLVAAGAAVHERLLLDALIFEELDLGHAVTVARATGMIYPARSGAEAREPLA
ncbi:hypothetical protein [Brachybacterium squillarum]|uniref:hypothetical protein n=1 Tax=Brachybacterium squillarum TaxID=661979 RepID=UPI0022215214|nr:hypothetical protein [Brachybacterium squillarum]MCW1804071.1 hypothetical protein [Brachybacterium squillarum]